MDGQNNMAILSVYVREMFDTNIKRIYDRDNNEIDPKYLPTLGDSTIPTIGFDTQIPPNKYGEGTLLAGLETVANTVLRLLNMIPGQYPSIPNLGINIKKYLLGFYDEFTEDDLLNDIVTQCSKLAIYVNDESFFKIEKTLFNNEPVIILRFQSSKRNENNNDGSLIDYINIGITFDKAKQVITSLEKSWE